jgi:hypothetical protein
MERRSGVKRRKFSGYTGVVPERRSGKDRRVGPVKKDDKGQKA